jgi:Cytochrome c554 and c-prime
MNEGLGKLCKTSLILGALVLLWAPPKSETQQLPKRRAFDPLPDWRPTHAPPGAHYVGNQVCSQCHSQGETQSRTPMAQALEPPNDRRLLLRYSELTFRNGPFSYSVRRQNNESLYTVTDGKESVTVVIRYAFGQGQGAQTYVLEYRGRFYEGRVSYYTRLDGLDLTPGASQRIPSSLEAALGRPLEPGLLNDCFSCHATSAVSEGQLQLNRMFPGITCEGCHGPGEKHMLAMKAHRGVSGDNQILNPGRFDTEGLTQFCGACHRSWVQVQMMGIRGVANVRFQPYRLFNSKCYGHKDERISCIACHNPHEETVREPRYYDAKCLACHRASPAESSTKAAACKKGTENCVSCHMPKTELPEAHYQFTDHQIRVVRPGDPYPN